MAAAPRQASDAVLEVLPLGEYVVPQDAACFRSLVNGFNIAYNAGFKVMLWVLIVLLWVFSFPLGIFASLVQFMGNLWRVLAASWGKLWSDAAGYGPWARTRAAFFAMKRSAVHSASPAAAVAPAVSTGRSVPLLVAAELGMAEDSGMLRTFNSMYSAGFATGTVLLVLFAFLFSPFVGAFVAAWTVFADLWRMWARIAGRLVLELLGLGSMVDEHIGYMQTKINAAGGSAPTGGAAAPAAAAAAAMPPVVNVAYLAPSAVAVPLAGYGAPAYHAMPAQQALMAHQYGAPAASGSYQGQDPVGMHGHQQQGGMYPSKDI